MHCTTNQEGNGGDNIQAERHCRPTTPATHRSIAPSSICSRKGAAVPLVVAPAVPRDLQRRLTELPGD
jgi:hypothetical protein